MIFVRILLPGAKKTVVRRKSDASKDYEPQCLLLCNLTELCRYFCQEHRDMMDDINFITEFCELIPKYSKTVSSLGKHHVYIIHKNNFMAENVSDILIILML